MIVEIPQGSRNKYEMNHDTGEIWLDRTLFTATQYPLDYGFFPNTLGEDGDPLDALVWLSQPTFSGCHVMVRPVAVFWMSDEKGPDAKVLCVASHDPRYAAYQDIEDLPEHLLDEVGNFLQFMDMRWWQIKTMGKGNSIKINSGKFLWVFPVF